MSHSKQQPAANKTDPLYSRRKAQYPMPPALKQQILASGKAKLEQSKPTYWLRPPIWAASFAAVFAIVISVQFLPQQDKMQPTVQSDIVQSTEPQMRKAKPQTAIDTLSDSSYEATMPASPESRLYAPSAERQPQPQQQKLKRTAPEPQPAPMTQAASESEIWVNGAVVVRAQLQPEVKGQPRQVKDCYGAITELRAQNLEAFADGQWLDIHYFEDGTIMRILKTAKQNQHCP